MNIRPLTPHLGAELSVDFNDLSDKLFREIYQAFLRYQVLVFPPQDLPPAQQVALARHFGEVQIHVMNQYHADGFPELYRLSNLDANGKPSGKHPDKGTLFWHTDGSWRERTAQATLMYSAWSPRNTALRPVSGWVRMIGCATGGTFAFCSALSGSSP